MKTIAKLIVGKRKIVYIVYAAILILSGVGVFFSNINYDMSEYLPDDSSVRSGMEIMSEEFGETSAITAMFDGLDDNEQLKRQQELEKIDGVQSVVHLQNDELYQKDGHSKYMITVEADTYSEKARQVLEDIKTTYGDSVYLSGAVTDNDKMISTLLKGLPIIGIIAVAVIFVILFILCDSWIEPLIYVGCIGVAIIINMGTNALLPSVSFMTFSVGALLQLGLSIDYSIMLMNRYSQEKKKHSSSEKAMINALANSFAPVSGSSVTTIVGLLALIFMSFKIGQDMGIVLAKGVFISLLTIFTVLPCIVVSLDKLIEKTKKKSINIKMGKVMKAVTKLGVLILPLTAVAVGFSFVNKDDVNVNFLKSFVNEDQAYIEECMGLDNQIVLLYKNNESPDNISSYIEWLESRDDVNSVQDYSNTIGKSLTSEELAVSIGADKNSTDMMFQMLGKNTMTIGEFLDAAKQMPGIDSESLAKLEAAEIQIDESSHQMRGKDYNRMVISAKYSSEGESTFNAVGEMMDKANEVFSGEHCFVGDSVMGKEMNDSFNDELNFITLLTTAAIFIVVLLTFRAVFSSAVLVAVIQSAVYITTFIIVQLGFTVNYIALILVQCILMGATIDYGIMFISNYLEERKKNDKKISLKKAMDRSIKTILTSSLILIGCCLTTGLLMTQEAISQTCIMIACGTAVAAVMIIFVLPIIVYLTDKLIIKQFGRRKIDNNKIAA